MLILREAERQWLTLQPYVTCFWDEIDTDTVSEDLTNRSQPGGNGCKAWKVWNVVIIAENHGPNSAIGAPGDIWAEVKRRTHPPKLWVRTRDTWDSVEASILLGKLRHPVQRDGKKLFVLGMRARSIHWVRQKTHRNWMSKYRQDSPSARGESLAPEEVTLADAFAVLYQQSEDAHKNRGDRNYQMPAGRIGRRHFLRSELRSSTQHSSEEGSAHTQPVPEGTTPTTNVTSAVEEDNRRTPNVLSLDMSKLTLGSSAVGGVSPEPSGNDVEAQAGLLTSINVAALSVELKPMSKSDERTTSPAREHPAMCAPTREAASMSPLSGGRSSLGGESIPKTLPLDAAVSFIDRFNDSPITQTL